jgi:hypothetical protein
MNYRTMALKLGRARIQAREVAAIERSRLSESRGRGCQVLICRSRSLGEPRKFELHAERKTGAA